MVLHAPPGFFGRYLLLSAIVHVAWETAHLPLYTLWHTAPPGELVFAVLHCTAGDLLIATATLLLACWLVGGPGWLSDTGRFGRVVLVAVLTGLAYTVFSEWLNTEVRGSWAYAAQMPRLPPFGTGLSPVAQWLIVPPLCLHLARRHARSPDASWHQTTKRSQLP